MTRFYKDIQNGYIIGFGTNGSDDVTAITEQEYNTLRTVFDERPTPPVGYGYLLKTDLTWELVEEEEPDLDDEEVLAVLLGGAE